MHYSGCLPTGTMSAHLLPPPWNPAYLTIFKQTDQMIGLVPRGRAPMARRRNRFCSALLDDYCAALVAGHDPMHRWVTGRREARWRCLLCSVPSLTCQLTWRRVAPDLAAAWSGAGTEVYRPAHPLQFISGGVRGSGRSCCSLPHRPQPVNSQVRSEEWLGWRLTQ